MTCKVTVQKNTFSESLANVGRVVGSHSNLPRVQDVQGLPGCNLSPYGREVRFYGCSWR